MSKILLTILFSLLFVQQAVSQLPASQKKDKLNISFNKNIELLASPTLSHLKAPTVKQKF